MTATETFSAVTGDWRSFLDGTLLSAPAPEPSENLALLVTSAEKAMWQDRAANGPFRIAGDLSANSPGHWTEMNACMSLDFTSARWDGPTDLYGANDPDGPEGAVRRGQLSANMPPGPTRRMAHDMMSAAYAAITTDNTTVAQAVTNEIEYQAGRAKLDYSNRTLWPLDFYDDINPLFMHALWVKDYVLAYAVTKAMGYGSATVEQWFLDLAELCEDAVRNNMTAVFPNRSADSYFSRASFVDETVYHDLLLSNGTALYYPRILLFYNNRRNNQAGFFGLVGTLLDNTYYVNEFKRYMREWVTFGHSLSGSNAGHWGDVNRGQGGFPQLGVSYGFHGMETSLQVMDALARQGDTSLYDYSSSDGSNVPTWGTNHPKAMEGVLDLWVKWIARTWPAHYDKSGSAGDSYYRIHSRNTANNREIVNDGHLLMAACYYNRSDWQDVILRVGTPSGFTSSLQGVGAIYNNWREDWRQRFLRALDANPHGGA